MQKWNKENIKALRNKLKLSQTSFAGIMGVTRNYIYYLEKGVKAPSKTLTLLLDCVEEKLKKGDTY